MQVESYLVLAGTIAWSILFLSALPNVYSFFKYRVSLDNKSYVKYFTIRFCSFGGSCNAFCYIFCFEPGHALLTRFLLFCHTEHPVQLCGSIHRDLFKLWSDT